MIETIGYVGMTHLGLSSAAGALARGARVLCFDPNAELVSALLAGNLPINEPELEETLCAHVTKLEYSADPMSLKECDVVYVAPDVKTNDIGASDLSDLMVLLDIAEKQVRHDATLVILSQVPPGFTRPRANGRAHYYYQVETLVFGRAVERARDPERFIVGCADPRASLPPAYEAFLARFDCPILTMRYESAELAKIAINCFLVAQVSTTNTLAEICESIDADWSEIAPALRLDERIGAKAYLKPGLGIAGGNLERDLATIIDIGAQHGTDTGVIEAEIVNSHHRKGAVVRFLQKQVLKTLGADARIAVWGLAYKENTHSIKNSPSLATIAAFSERQFWVHDPVVSAEAVGLDNIEGAADPLSAASGTDVLLILTPWDEYREIAPAQLAGAMRGNVVVDPYGVLDATAAADAGLTVVVLGKPADLGDLSA